MVKRRKSAALPGSTPVLVALLVALPCLAGTRDTRVRAHEWTSAGPEGFGVVALAIDPLKPRILYAGAWGAGVYKSTDGGQRWGPASQGLTDRRVMALIIDPQTPTTLYAVGWGASGGVSGVFKSTDGGTTWSLASSGLPVGTGQTSPTQPPPPTVLKMVIDPRNPAILYAACLADGVFRSTDGGGSWKATISGLPTYPGSVALAIDPQVPTTLYANLP